MTTYNHQFANLVNRSGFMGGSAVPEYRTIEFNLSADQVAAGNIFNFLRIPADALVLDVFLHADELDGGTAITIDVGYDGSTDAFLDGDDLAQTGGTEPAGAGIPLLPRDPTDPVDTGDAFTEEEGTVISARIDTGPTTAQAGRLALTVGFIRTR